MSNLAVITPHDLRAVAMSILILLVGLVPSFVHVSFETSSLAIGLLLLILSYGLYLVKYAATLTRVNERALVFGCVFALYNVFSIALNNEGQIKSLAGLGLLFFMVISASLFAKYMCNSGDAAIRKSITFIFIVMTLIGISGIFFNAKPEFYQNPKAVFPFSEPSHFALYYGLFCTAFYAINHKSRNRFIPVVSIMIFGLYVQNLTILVYLILVLLLELNLNVRALITVSVAFLMIIMYVSGAEYFMERMVLSSDSQNLSALVYLQGLDDAYNALINTDFRGLGLQMLGTQEPSTVASQISFVLGKEGEVNRTDGSFLAAKVVAELGIAGILLVLMYLRYFFKALLSLRSVIHGSQLCEPVSAVLSGAVLYSFSVEMFVRGYGYFSPGLFLLMVCAFIQGRRSKWKPSTT